MIWLAILLFITGFFSYCTLVAYTMRNQSIGGLIYSMIHLAVLITSCMALLGMIFK